MALVSTSPALEVALKAPEAALVAGQAAEFSVELRYAAGETPDLFSFGVRLLPTTTVALRAEAIEVVPELDHSGFAGGALVSLPDLAAKGNVALPNGPPPPYAGTELFRIRLVPLRAGVLELELDLYRTAGPEEDVFVTTSGLTLDDEITFVPTTMEVLEAPRLVLRRIPGEPRLELQFGIVPGYRSRVLHSDDLSAWQTLSTAVGDGSVVIHHDLTDRPTGFFRLDCEALDAD